MSKYVITLTMFIVSSVQEVLSQDQQAIQTDRPDQTECPFTVPRRHFQIETGFGYEKANADEQNFLYPTILWKYGVNEKFELRLITELAANKTNDKNLSGFNPVKIGFKTKLVDEKGIIPSISFIAHLSLPFISSRNFRSGFVAPLFRFTLQHTLSEKVSLGYNIGAEWDGESVAPTYIYTLTSGFAISRKMGAYFELYGFAPQKDKAEHRADGGISFFPKPNLMIDFSGGFGITSNAPRYYGAIGFSARIPN
jgi:hypothetical protein